MPSKKADVFVDYRAMPVIRGVKVGHDLENDCYWIDLREAKNKLQVKVNDEIFMRRSYIIRDFKIYYFSNILIEKTTYKVNIKIIYEKYGHHKFTGNDNIEEVTKILGYDYYSDFWNELSNYSYYMAYFCNLSTQEISKSIYLVGSYIIRNGKKLYLSDFLIGNTNNDSEIHGFYAHVLFQWLENSYLYHVRPYLFDKSDDNQ